MVKAVNLVLAFRARMASILSRTSREAAGGARQAYALSTTEFARRARLAHAISNIGAQGRAHANVMRTRTTSRASLTASGRAISTKPRPYAAPTHAAITTTVTGAATRARHASACSTKDFSHQLTVPTTVRARLTMVVVQLRNRFRARCRCNAANRTTHARTIGVLFVAIRGISARVRLPVEERKYHKVTWSETIGQTCSALAVCKATG